MTVSELIASYKAKIETEFGLSLSVIQAQKELIQYPVEKRLALCQLEQEIISALNSQLLTEWLIANSIPEELWEEYNYFNSVLLFRGEEVELDV